MSNYDKVAAAVSFLFFIFLMGVGGLMLSLRADPGFILGIGTLGLIGTIIVTFIKSRSLSKKPRYDIFE